MKVKWLFLLLAVFLSGCASTLTQDLWPPAAEQPRYRVDVLSSGLHSFILVHPTPEEPPVYKEYGFAEQAWDLEYKRGIFGAFRALFWPTKSVVEIKSFNSYDSVDKTGKKRSWHFALTKKGRDALIESLHAWYDPSKVVEIEGSPDNEQYYRGIDSYYIFRGCHHYTAEALKIAGIPMRPWWAFQKGLLGIQLTHAEKMQKKQGITIS